MHGYDGIIIGPRLGVIDPMTRHMSRLLKSQETPLQFIYRGRALYAQPLAVTVTTPSVLWVAVSLCQTCHLIIKEYKGPVDPTLLN